MQHLRSARTELELQYACERSEDVILWVEMTGNLDKWRIGRRAFLVGTHACLFAELESQYA
ncbi:hypothetical protein EP57_07960 [Listeria booriae]|uniref:Uncharacterized protein n=1 Tax=Listeria booriae TaxID=1552123 RepID=A0A099WBA6_9LIST|nr:hypothetical protein EP57_07960 [Listeria booriae]